MHLARTSLNSHGDTRAKQYKNARRAAAARAANEVSLSVRQSVLEARSVLEAGEVTCNHVLPKGEEEAAAVEAAEDEANTTGTNMAAELPRPRQGYGWLQ